MNILHIADFGKAGNFNGVGAAVLNLAHHQHIIGEKTIILYTRSNPSLNSDITIEISKKDEFSKAIIDFKPDIVIFHSFYDFKHPIYAGILSKNKIPYIITFHGGASKGNYKHKHFIKWVVNNLIFKRYIKNALAVVYLNDGERRNSIFHNLTNAKSLILPNGIIKPQAIHEYKLENGINFAFISRLDYIGKGLDILLPAIKSIEKELTTLNVKFRFYGYHYNDGIVEKIQELSPICEYCGFVQNDAKEKAFLETDVLILPSRSEGMPICVLEALSYGIPSIVTPQTNVAELIYSNHCGWVTNLDIDKLSDAILRAVSDLKANSKDIQKNCIQLSKKFEWRAIAYTSILQYKELLSNS